MKDPRLQRATLRATELANKMRGHQADAEAATNDESRNTALSLAAETAAKLTEANVEKTRLATEAASMADADAIAASLLDAGPGVRTDAPEPRAGAEALAASVRRIALAYAVGGAHEAQEAARADRIPAAHLATMRLSDAARGGIHVPPEWLAPAEHRPDPTIMRSLINVVQTTSDKVVIPKLLELADDNWTDEGHEYGTGDDDRQDAASPGVEIGLGQWHPRPVVMTEDLLQATSVEQEIAQRFRWALEFDLDRAVIRGNGVKRPLGVMSAPSGTDPDDRANKVLEIKTGHATALTVAGVTNLVYQHLEQWSEGSVIISRRPTFANILTLEDGAGHYIFQIGHAIAPNTILGVPVRFSPFVDSVGANKYPLIHGWWRAYSGVENRGALRFKRLIEKFDPNIGLSVSGRLGGAPVQNEAFTKLKVAL